MSDKQQWTTIIIAHLGKHQNEPPTILKLEMLGGVSTIITHVRLVGNVSAPVVRCELVIKDAQIQVYLKPLLVDPSQFEELLSEMFLIGWRKALVV